MGDGFTVSDIFPGDQHIGNITIYDDFIKMIAKKTQQRVKVVGMGVLDNKKENNRDKHQYRCTDGIGGLIDQGQQINQ